MTKCGKLGLITAMSRRIPLAKFADDLAPIGASFRNHSTIYAPSFWILRFWKIREARKGRIPIGPRTSARREDVTFKILPPLRMEAPAPRISCSAQSMH